MHKHALPFRKKGLANYELMFELLTKSTATGDLNKASTKYLLDTDEERALDDKLCGLGIDDSYDLTSIGDLNYPTQLPSSPPCTLSRKSGSDSTSSFQLRHKQSKGKAQQDTKDSVFLKWVGISERRNDILEQYIAFKQSDFCLRCSTSNVPILSVPPVGGSSGNATVLGDDPYLKGLLMTQALLGEDEQTQLLKGCRELQTEFAQKAFLVMTDSQQRAWLDSF